MNAASDHPARSNVLGVGVDAVEMDSAVGETMEAARSRSPFAVSALAVHGLVTAFRDPELNRLLAGFGLVVPDGQPVRWALNLLHRAGLGERVYGPELMLRLCESAARESIPVYLFGSTPEVVSALVDRLVETSPDLEIAGAEPSLFRSLGEAERDALAERIRSSGAGICFVGLGCPRQEVFAGRMAGRVGMPVVAVGAAFEMNAGLVSRAPAWMQRRGIEWLFRLVQEPARLWRRYLLLNPVFAVMLLAQASGLWKPRKSEAAADRGEEGPVPG